MLRLEKVSVSLPFELGSVEWKPDPTARKAAWSLYVELATRVALQPRGAGEGLLGEALTSLHSLFGTTRQILKEAGPDVGATPDSVGGVAIAVLNVGLRPFLDRWHPLLQVWESQRPPQISVREHEENWADRHAMRAELNAMREQLAQYARALATFAGVKP